MIINIAGYAAILNPSRDVMKLCKSQLSMANPAFAKNERLGVSNFATKRTLYYYTYNEETDVLKVPIGFWSEHLSNLPYKDLRTDVLSEELKSYSFNGELRENQVELIKKLDGKTNGILSSPTGSGKTVMIIYKLKQLGRKALVLVDTIDLAKQFKARLEYFLGYSPGMVGSGKFEIKDITIGILQTVVSLDQEKLRIVNNSFGVVFTDECHIMAANTYFGALSRLKMKFKFAASATPERSDGLTDVIYWSTGPLLASGKMEDFMDDLTFPEFEYIPTSYSYPILTSREFTEMCDDMSEDNDRNRLIVEARQAHAGRKAAILCTTKKHVYTLQEMIENSRALTSSTKKKDREQAIPDFIEGKYDTIISTVKLFNKGIDISDLEVIILAGPSKEKNLIKQTIGRVIRKKGEGKKALFIDIYDPNVGMLMAQHRKRKTIYKIYINLKKVQDGRSRMDRGRVDTAKQGIENGQEMLFHL